MTVVLKWRFLCVELTLFLCLTKDFGGWKGVARLCWTDVLNWRVCWTKVSSDLKSISKKINDDNHPELCPAKFQIETFSRF